jgi:hypothetical protein
MDTIPKVSINIVHVNGEKIIDNCLKSLSSTNYENYEINLLLNSTTDQSEKIAKKYRCRIFKSKKNMGFAGGHNFLAEKSRSDYIAVLNNDIEVEKQWLIQLVDFSVKNNADICQPKIKSLRNKNYFESAGACGGFMDKYGYEFYRGRIFDTVEEDKGQYETPRRIFWACGSCMLIKKPVIDQIGLFDEDFFMYSEEFDFCWRANIHGCKIYCNPKSVVYHLGSYSVKTMKMNSEKEYLLHRNVFLTFLINYSDKNFKKYIFQRTLLEIISGISFPKKIIPVSRALYYVIKNRDSIAQKRKKTQKLRKAEDSEYSEVVLKKSIPYLYFIRKRKTFDKVERYF